VVAALEAKTTSTKIEAASKDLVVAGAAAEGRAAEGRAAAGREAAAGANETDNEFSDDEDSMDASNMVLGASDIAFVLPMSVSPAANGTPDSSKSSGNDSNGENVDRHGNAGTPDSFATPPRTKRTPLNTPPPSLFKTDIVDSIVEQHHLRESSQHLTFSEEDQENEGR
jgi:hypothetical protein